ncbi:ataxin-7-like protein 2a [Chanos chanos]|uniref:Ataxin-7-like protein 2a n=1 Tax=Chanos chanos TaxID=29144 RepID=A0A6J2VNV6_CHACN|nr:ataxin-7-like protein 2 [Chanos chanos]
MMAVRERAVKVMAALERRVPCLDDFVGQSWSVWAERANVTLSEGSDADDCGKNGKKTTETMTLRKEDMSIFGHYPGHDEFYLVVCSHCSQVVKPQAFEKHCERRHGPLAKLFAHLRSNPPASQQRPRPPHTASSHGTASWTGRNQGVGPPRTAPQSPSTPPQYRHSKAPKEGVRLSPLEKTSSSGHSESSVFKQPPPLEPPRSSPPPSLRDPPWPHGSPSPSRASPSERPLAQREGLSSAPVPAHLRGPRTYKISRKELDLDKHCGVLDPERKKVCTRLLTCNIHSIHQRRKVLGRSKNFDQLVAELKMSSKSRERVAQVPEGSASQSPSPEPPRDSTGSPHCRRPLTNSPAFRTRALSESGQDEEKSLQDESTARPPSPLPPGRISSEESEGEGVDEAIEWHSSPWHPKPLALCSFGSHAVGHGIFTFDRRLHHLRSAMSAMLENHLNAYLWKKIPQATDLQSQISPPKPAAITISPSSISQHSKMRAGSQNSTSLRTSYSSHNPGKELHAHSSSTSKAYGQSENSGGSQSVAPPKPARTPTQSGPGRPRNPVGRPSKQQLRVREAERAAASAAAAAAAALRKRKASFSEEEGVSPDRNCVSQDRGRPIISGKTPSAPHGQTNGSLSPGSKPRPQLSPSEPHTPSSWAFKRTHLPSHHSPPEPAPHSRGGDSGLHSRAASYDHRGLGKKRKSSASPPSKPHRLPTSSHTGFYPWKDSKVGGLSVGVEKKLSTPKPKLHH